MGHKLPDAIARVLTEDGTATLGYNANCAGVGDGHVFDKRTIDGYLAAGVLTGFEEQHVSVYAIDCNLGIAACIALSFREFVYPDEIFAPSDIYLL